MKYTKELLLLIILCLCTTASVQQAIRVQTRRVSSSRISVRLTRRETIQ